MLQGLVPSPRWLKEEEEEERSISCSASLVLKETSVVLTVLLSDYHDCLYLFIFCFALSDWTHHIYQNYKGIISEAVNIKSSLSLGMKEKKPGMTSYLMLKPTEVRILSMSYSQCKG